MANISALGSAPLSFVDASGKQFFIPLSFISYAQATGAPAIAASWQGWSSLSAAAKTADQAEAATWLNMLATLGYILPAPVPPAQPAFSITALAPGAAGNDITISFTAQATDGTLSVTVSTRQTYAGLVATGTAANSIATVLGTAPGGGTSPGLAYVSQAFTSDPPAAPAANFQLLGGADYECEPVAGAGTLTASNDPANADAGNITATINNGSAAGTFDLILAWSKSATGVKPASLGSVFGYLISVAQPPGGFGPTPAVPSTITLAGGSDATSTAAAAAGASVISG